MLLVYNKGTKCYGWIGNVEKCKKVVIPEGVTSIGDRAFHGCSSLISIDIPESVKSIGEGAFYKCSGLTSINIPKSVTTIGRETFCKCSNLTSVNIPEGVKSIGTSAFSGCSSLDVVIDNSKDNVKVGKDAFYRCKSVTWLKE
jgi:hypothetical protein